MVALVDCPANQPGVVLGILGRRVHATDVPVTRLQRAKQCAINVSARAGLEERPTVLLGVLDRIADVLVGVGNDLTFA